MELSFITFLVIFAFASFGICQISEGDKCKTGDADEVVCKANATTQTLSNLEQECEKIKYLNIPLPLSDHITHDHSVDVGEFPHMAAIAYEVKGSDDEEYLFKCSGTLISKNFVLSMAHCASRKNNRPKMVRLGKASIDLTDTDDRHAPQDILIKNVHIHPQYTSTKKYNDIALIELASEAIFNERVIPACLCTSTATLHSTQELLVSGWGLPNEETGKRSNWMMRANMEETSLDSCNDAFKPLLARTRSINEGILQTQMCALSADNETDVCANSGSPLQFRSPRQNSEKRDTFYVVGLSSFGVGCHSTLPDVYTRVAEFTDWIEQIVWTQKISNEVKHRQRPPVKMVK